MASHVPMEKRFYLMLWLLSYNRTFVPQPGVAPGTFRFYVVPPAFAGPIPVPAHAGFHFTPANPGLPKHTAFGRQAESGEPDSVEETLL